MIQRINPKAEIFTTTHAVERAIERIPKILRKNGWDGADNERARTVLEALFFDALHHSGRTIHLERSNAFPSIMHDHVKYIFRPEPNRITLVTVVGRPPQPRKQKRRSIKNGIQ